MSYTRINGIEYRLEGDSASVTDITPVNANILPFVTHNGRTYSVNIIARRALRDGVETLQIPNTVTFINIEAFANCTSLKEVYIPNSVENFSASSLATCQQLRKMHFPNGTIYRDKLFAYYNIGKIIPFEHLEEISFDRLDRKLGRLQSIW